MKIINKFPVVVVLAAFIWAVRSGQYEDTCTPSMRVLLDDAVSKSDGCSASAPRTEAERFSNSNHS